eukprot:5243532-Pyramimonas_sp.AAC.1
MLKSETANSKGLSSGTLLWDMAKFYDGISLERLELHCQQLQFPPVLYRLSIAAHRGARCMCMGNYVSGPFCAVRGSLRVAVPPRRASRFIASRVSAKSSSPLARSSTNI